MNQDHRANHEVTRATDTLSETGQTRRKMVRAGIKLAFVAPVVSTFLAKDAMAAASILSCYPTGHACDTGSTEEFCCNGLACVGNVCT